ncbi:MAG: ABC transporter ATP-binding protein [Cyanobacteria bacterium P01_H01_bin.15]
MPKLEFLDVSVQFQLRRTKQWVTALHEIRFEIPVGQFVAIVGPSGCGKTTLLNLAAGLVPPTSGKLLIDGQLITGTHRDCAMVFQSAALMPWRTVLANVIYGLELQGCHLSTAKSRARYFIELVGLQGFEESFPHELSGGMKQRVNLARALAVEPNLLLFDEPLSALDAQSREYMQGEIQRIWLQTRNTAIYVTHQINEAIFLADRVLVMTSRPGQISDDIQIDFPRPRTRDIKRDSQFLEIEDNVWQQLQPYLH